MIRLLSVTFFLLAPGAHAEQSGIRGALRDDEHRNKQSRKLMLGESETAVGEEEVPLDPATTAAPVVPTAPALPATTAVPATPATTVPPVPATSTGSLRTGGFCLCDRLCSACSSFGTDIRDCQITCSLVGKPDCQDQCMTFIRTGQVPGGGDIRDDFGTQPPLPTQPPTGPCPCIERCESCRASGSKTKPCQTVCELASDPECTPKCNAALNLPWGGN